MSTQPDRCTQCGRETGGLVKIQDADHEMGDSELWGCGYCANVQMESEIVRLREALDKCCYCNDPSYRSVEPCAACDALGRPARQ